MNIALFLKCSLKQLYTGCMKKNNKECKWFPVCPMNRFYQMGKIAEKWIEKYCKGDWTKCVRFQMEEKGEPHPDNMLPNGEIDENLS